MPFFDYRCFHCHIEVEILTKNSDTIQICENCLTSMTKLMSPIKAFILKGDGFYKQSKD